MAWQQKRSKALCGPESETDTEKPRDTQVPTKLMNRRRETTQIKKLPHKVNENNNRNAYR